jgi:diguanylate cyclase (GGDEF)-like protein
MPERLLRRLPLLGLLVALLFWVLNAFIDVSLFGMHNSFREALFEPSPSELWMRSVVAVLMLAFSWYARRLGIRLADSLDQIKAKEAELDSHRDMQHVLRRQADELNRQVMRQEREQAALRDLAYLDPLTGLYNRRRMEEILEAARRGEQLRGIGLGVMLCDIDHFKAVNEAVGQFTADRLLVRMGQLLRGHFRRGDAVGRWGGEQFLVVLSSLNESEAEVIAENFRARVEREAPMPQGKLTVSVGLAMMRADEGAEGLLARADRAVMLARQSGGNRLYVSLKDPAPAESAGLGDCRPFLLKAG